MSTYRCSSCGFENEPSAKYCGNCGCDLSEVAIGSERIGTTLLGRYKIRRVIAVGGMGVVYEADQSLGDYHRTVAIKTLRPELSLDQVIVSRFNRECGIVAQLTHQNTVSLYDYGTTEDGTLYIAMEFVRGRAFSEVIAEGPLALERTLGIVDQMCHSLEEAHELGIIHRDLKPDNVVLTHHGSDADFVKLLDFGIAVRLSVGTNHETKLTQKGMILGTPPYMSPEQFTGALVTRQSDIYSLGIITYEALMGRLPFDADTPWMWAQRHLTSAPPDLPPGFPSAVVNTVRAALSKDPASRPRSTLEFSRMLAGGTTAELAPGGFVAIGTSSVYDEKAKTQPDAIPLTSLVLPVSSNDGIVAKTDPAAVPLMMGNIGTPALQGIAQGSLSAYGNAAPRSALHERPRRRNRGALIGLIAGAGVVLCIVGVALAYSLDLIVNPFVNDGPPSALPSLPSATGLSSGSVELTPNALPADAPILSEPSNTRTRPRPTVPAPSNTAPHGEPAPSATVPGAPSGTASSSPGGFGLPPLVLPSNLPSLPPLPSSIAGIPIPQLFPGPAVSPSAQTPPTPGP